jgi:transcriptional regulator with XRE-family HTH domain
MKVDVELLLKLRRERAWSQDELATASGLNLRTIQRIEKEAVASLQSMKSLAAAFDMGIRELELEESDMISELLGKDVTVVMGMSPSKVTGFYDDVKGKIVEIGTDWLKLMDGKTPVYINIIHIKRIIPK